jgi:alcohol dehydrogenase class IV
MQFEFSSPTKILFGPGSLNSIGPLVDAFGKKPFIVSGCPQAVLERLLNLLDIQKVAYSWMKIDREPNVAMMRELVMSARHSSSDVVIGIGGGSAIDSAKATAAMLANPGKLSDYLEVIGLNKPLLNPSIPMIAIPTTSGTGSEVTRNAVISSPDHHVKVSLRSQYLFPKIALVDPVVTLSIPPLITAYTGLDTLTQLMEPYTCITPNPLTDAICREGIQRVSRSLLKAYDCGDDLDARVDMSLASLCSGLALANARLGAVHGLAGPIGGEIPAPHGQSHLFYRM